MAAYNWINFEAQCPHCKQVARIRCQTHIASDFAGEQSGRFCDREYELGDKMAWWPEDHKSFASWRASSEPNQSLDQAVEACYAACGHCQTSLCAVIQFDNLHPTQFTFLGLEADWPEGYSR